MLIMSCILAAILISVGFLVYLAMEPISCIDSFDKLKDVLDLTEDEATELLVEAENASLLQVLVEARYNITLTDDEAKGIVRTYLQRD
jgi:hypothetical protein